MQTDPYSSPASNMYPPAPVGSAVVSQAVMQQLAGTKPWVRFMSVLMFVAAGFMLLAAFVIAIAGSQIGKLSSSASGAQAFSGAMGLVVAVVYAALSIVYIYPALKLWKYATRIGVLLLTGSEGDLVEALSQQRSFWKFIGILVLIVFVLYFVAIFAVIAFGGVAAMNARH